MKMASYPQSLMYGHCSLSANNGESSQASQTKLRSDVTPPFPNTEGLLSNNAYLGAAAAGSSHTTAIDPYQDPEGWVAEMLSKIVAPLPNDELIDHTRVANGHLLKAQADAVPHYHYPSGNFAHLTTATIKTYGSTPPTFAIAGDVHLALPDNHQGYHTTKRVATPYPNKTTAPSSITTASTTPRLRRTPPRACKPPKRNFITKRNKLALLKIYTKNFHCPSIAARAPGDTRRLIKFYSKRILNSRRPRFYRKRFLAGPPEKMDADDNRIFYVREFLCTDMM